MDGVRSGCGRSSDRRRPAAAQARSATPGETFDPQERAATPRDRDEQARPGLLRRRCSRQRRTRSGRLHAARCGGPVLRPQQRLGHPGGRGQSGQAPDVRRGLGPTSQFVAGGRRRCRSRPASRPTASPRSRWTSRSTRTPGSGTTAPWPARTTTRNTRARGHVDRWFLVSTVGGPSCSVIVSASTPGNARSPSSSTAGWRRSRSLSR